MKPFAYCAAIRTLGRAGHKYLRLLQSLQAQTQPPLKILVYLADDCPPPPETLGCETLVRVPRGMVAQRALPCDEVTPPYRLPHALRHEGQPPHRTHAPHAAR